MTRQFHIAPGATADGDAANSVAWLARRAARCNLSLRDARALFDALYIADATMLEHGNHSAAARRAGLDRTALGRMRDRSLLIPEDC